MACPSEPQHFVVNDIADARVLARAANCTGGGNFSVDWGSWVQVEETISISNGTVLSVHGLDGGVIDGGSTTQLFEVSGAALYISSLGIERGNGSSGGAIWAAHSSAVTLVNCNLSDNTATEAGGAVEAFNASKLSLEGTNVFRNNSVSSQAGGAVALQEYSELLVSGRSTFVDNRAESGGALASVDESIVSVTGEVHFVNNTATDDGGAVLGVESNLTIWSDSDEVWSSFIGNSAEDLAGALYWRGSIENTYTVDLARVTLAGNSALNGGASYISAEALINMNNCSFKSNEATGDGGAIILQRVGDKDATEIVACTFEDNYAGSNGGALVVTDGSVAVVNSTFSRNVAADTGGAAVVESGYDTRKYQLTMSECVLSYNKAATGTALATFDRTEELAALAVSNIDFVENTLLCGTNKFLDQDTNPTYEDLNTDYGIACDLCPSWSECTNCSISNPQTIHECSDLPDYTTSLHSDGTLASLFLYEGYWRTSNTSKDVRQCHNEDACRGGEAEMCGDVNCVEGYCAAGYTGPYCAVCLETHTGGVGHTCYQCDEESTTTREVLGVLALFVLVLLFSGAYRFLTSPGRGQGKWGTRWERLQSRLQHAVPLQKVKIIIVAWQIISEFTSVVSVTFPSYYREFIGWIEVVEFDLAWVATLGCDFRINFYHRLLAVTISPLVMLALLGLTFWISWRRHRNDERSMAKVRRNHLAVLILITFFIYSTASSLIFQTFSCDALDDGNSYLRADYSLLCHLQGGGENLRHLRFMIYAGFMLLIYPLGIPILYAALLYWRGHQPARVGGRPVLPPDTFDEEMARRDAIERERSIARTYESMIMDLWEPYRHERGNYEVVECVRRVMLTGVVVFVSPNSVAQISTTFLIGLLFFVLFEALDPYISSYDRWMARFGHIVVLLSMFVALMLKVDLSDEHGADVGVYSIILVVANLAMVLAVVGETVATSIGAVQE